MITRVYLAEIDPLESENVYNCYYDEMPEDRKLRTDKLKHLEDKKRSVAAFALLKKAYNDYVHEFFGRSIDELPDIEYTSRGKAYFVDSDFFFNLSHSGSRVLCSIGMSSNGCDIEKIRTKSTGVAKRFFNQNEYEYVENHLPQNDYFTKIWTLKESVLKACGQGIGYPMDTFCVIESEKITKKIILSDELGVYYIKNYPEADGYEISCACSEDGFDESVKHIQL